MGVIIRQTDYLAGMCTRTTAITLHALTLRHGGGLTALVTVVRDSQSRDVYVNATQHRPKIRPQRSPSFYATSYRPHVASAQSADLSQLRANA
jgi:hypothetical protein